MGQPVTITDGLSARGPSPSPSSSKRGRGDSPSTRVGEGSSKRAHLVEGGEQDVMTPFFRLPIIFPSRVPITSE